jgi:hypothetical protein
MRALDVLRIPAIAVLAVMLSSCAFLKKFSKQTPEPTPETPGLIPGDQAKTQNIVSTTPAADTLAPPPPKRTAPVIDDGLRLPDMLALPSDRELRKPATPSPAPEGGGVSARPPVSD